jgi:hypothetical protein
MVGKGWGILGFFSHKYGSEEFEMSRFFVLEETGEKRAGEERTCLRSR